MPDGQLKNWLTLRGEERSFQKNGAINLKCLLHYFKKVFSAIDGGILGRFSIALLATCTIHQVNKHERKQEKPTLIGKIGFPSKTICLETLCDVSFLPKLIPIVFISCWAFLRHPLITPEPQHCFPPPPSPDTMNIIVHNNRLEGGKAQG